MSAFIKRLVIPCQFAVGQVVEFAIGVTPSTLWPNTEWSVFGVGRVTVGLNAGDADFDTLRKVGGKKGHKMTEGNLIAHTHTVSDKCVYDNASNNSVGLGTDHKTETVNTSSTGSADPEAIPTIQPYIVTQKWERTA